jgi:hypothetical protein
VKRFVNAWRHWLLLVFKSTTCPHKAKSDIQSIKWIRQETEQRGFEESTRDILDLRFAIGEADPCVVVHGGERDPHTELNAEIMPV